LFEEILEDEMKSEVISLIKRASSLAAIALICVFVAAGQSNTGSITGTVQDPNGAGVPNASVTVRNMGTNEAKTVVTDEDGRYEAASLSTGSYSVTAKVGGFQDTTVSDARLAVGDKLRVDVTMTVSGVSAVVTVADQTTTNTETATIGDTITQERIANNPVNGRDFTQLLATVPGSVQSTNQFQTSINGIPSTFGGTSVLVDGIDAGRVDLNGTSNVLGRIESRVNRVSIDSIQEVQVLEQSYSAQYGEALSAVINPITKSGTNSLHGGVFDYFRNESLDANDFFNNAQNLSRSKFRLNQFGGNVSGAIAKDKLFFFANYEGVRQTRGQLFTALTPTQAFRNATAAALQPALATLPLPLSPFTFAGQASPSPDLGFYAVQKNGKLREDTGSVKIDWNHTDRSHFSARYNINDSDTTTPYGVGTDQTADGTLRVQLFKLSHNYAFSGNVINEAAFGINDNRTHAGAGPSQLPSFSFLFADSAIANIGPAQFDQIRSGTVYQFLDTLSMIHGNHSLKAGADIRLNRRSAESLSQTTYQYGSIGDFKINSPFSVSTGGNPKLDYANENFSFFFQDDWKVHPRLSLNLGIRYQVSTVSREKNGYLQNFDLTTLTLTPRGQKIYDMDTNNWGPRLGFAFDVFGNKKTVIRGGYGIFYNRELPASFGSPQANSFLQPSVTILDLLGLGYCANGTGSIAYPINPAIYNGCGVAPRYSIERKLKTPEAQQWSFNIQQDLGVGVLQVGYVGNHVTHLLTDGVVSPRNLNRADIDFFGFGLRRLPQFGDIFLVGSYPSSTYNALQATFKRNLSTGIRFNANYTWSHTIDDVVGFFKDYQNEFDTSGERASSDQDVRHNFVFDASYDIPSARKWFGDGFPVWLGNGWQISTISQFRTGLPVNVTRKGGTFGGFSGRPNLVPGVDPYCSNYNVPDCQFNAAAFTDPVGTFTPGNTPRNYLRGPGFAQVDLSVTKNTRLSENAALQLRIDIFNLFNKANFADPSGGLTTDDTTHTLRPTAFFGRSVSTVGNQLGGLLGFGGPRQIQLSARITF
jgi:Carboxypeptidase regulatory-like domain/TonB dependent receptor/TonB-dependent Receptor Plug Domain